MTKIFWIVCGLCLLTACEPQPTKTTVSGTIVYVQENLGWSTPIHTVIKQADGKLVRVLGAYGQRGDVVTVTAFAYREEL